MIGQHVFTYLSLYLLIAKNILVFVLGLQLTIIFIIY